MDGLTPPISDSAGVTGSGVVLDLVPSIAPYLQHEKLSIKVDGCLMVPVCPKDATTVIIAGR